MLAMSATGGGTAVRSFRAALGVNHRVGFRFAPANGGGSTSMSRSEAGYDLFVRGIGLRCYHMVAISRRPGFLVSATPAALWQYLRKETTTPMDRRWLPAISAEMLNRGWIKRVNVAGSLASAVVAVDDAMMDECIVTLLSRGRVKIEG